MPTQYGMYFAVNAWAGAVMAWVFLVADLVRARLPTRAVYQNRAGCPPTQ
jgi:hypothetical protein